MPIYDEYLSVNRPARGFPNQVIYIKDLGQMQRWDVSTSTWALYSTSPTTTIANSVATYPMPFRVCVGPTTGGKYVADSDALWIPLNDNQVISLYQFAALTKVFTTNSAASFWVISVNAVHSDGSRTELFNFDTSTDTADTITTHNVKVASFTASSTASGDIGLLISVAKGGLTGTPGGLVIAATMFVQNAA